MFAELCKRMWKNKRTPIRILVMCLIIGYSYLLIRKYHFFFNKHGDDDKNCKFSDDFDYNLQKIKNLHFKDSILLMEELGLNKHPARAINYSLPVIVTGADYTHYMESQGLIKSIHEILVPKYPDVKLIYYDLGLKPEQLIQLKTYCQCEVRTFNYQKLPAHVKKLRTYAFKPIIIKMVYQEFGYIMWLDASGRFTTSDFVHAMDFLSKYKVLFFGNGPKGCVAFRTRIETFNFFQEKPCFYFKIHGIHTNGISFLRSHIANVIVTKWVACALLKGCIAPQAAIRRCPSLPKTVNNQTIGICHRYDQSILNILILRLFHQKKFHNFAIPSNNRWLVVKRGEIVNYFS